MPEKYNEFSAEIRRKHRQYFSKLGDLSWIFYLDYRKRLALGEFKAAEPTIFRYNAKKEFDLAEELKIGVHDSPTRLFAHAVADPFRHHVLTEPLAKMLEGDDIYPTDFLDETILEAERLRQDLPEELRQRELGQEIYGGFYSSLRTLTQFYLLKRVYSEIDGFHAAGPIHLTHLSISDFFEAQVGIGIYDAVLPPTHFSIFELLDLNNKKVGLNMQKLGELEYGARPPCPATYRPTPACENYILKRFNIKTRGNILFDQRDMLPPLIHKYLLNPFAHLLKSKPHLVKNVLEFEKSLLLGQKPY